MTGLLFAALVVTVVVGCYRSAPANLRQGRKELCEEAERLVRWKHPEADVFEVQVPEGLWGQAMVRFRDERRGGVWRAGVGQGAGRELEILWEQREAP